MGKHDIVTMVVRFQGRILGYLVRKRTARQAMEERVMCAKIRKQWAEQVATAEWRVPVFTGEDDGEA